MGFDLITHVRDGKGGIIRTNHYVLHIVDGKQEFERPPGSGVRYDAAGNKLTPEGVESPKAEAAAPAADVKDAQINELKAALAALTAKIEAKTDEKPGEAVEDLKEVAPTSPKPLFKK